MFGVAASFGAGAAHAQDPTSTLIQQLEQRLEEFERQNRVEQQGDPVITDPLRRADLPPPGGPTITLLDVEFENDSEFLSDAELRDIAQQYIGRPIDFSEIARLVRTVNDLYAERGIVTASAILPPQDLSDRVLNIRLIEGRLGSIAVVGDRRTRDQFILDRVRLVKGDRVVDVPTASRDITFSNRTSLMQMRMLLQPGATFGLTDIALGITEPPRNQLTAYVDNQGVESTGDVTAGLIWRHYGALGIDDSFLAFLTRSRGSVSGTFNYDLPVSSFGTRLGVGYTGTGTTVVDGPAEPLDVTGEAHAGTVTISQALLATTGWLVQANTSVSYGSSKSNIGPVPQVDALTTRVVVGVPISHTGERHNIYIQPQVVYAHVEDQLAPDPISGRDIVLFTGSGGGTLAYDQRYSAHVRGAWQYTGEELIPGNLLFNVGGPTTVRGYPSDGVAGDSGYFLQAELSRRFSESFAGLNTFVFADVGEVFSTFPDRTTLVSAGLGLSYDIGTQATFELTAAFPILDAMANQPDVAVYGRLTARMF
ncbi:ShlB/FhaC/HecB family hemolysin secretion/activation protein [Aquibium carbonis]|nr:POTRA domain-containing protein [Aquibium carbonis]